MNENTEFNDTNAYFIETPFESYKFALTSNNDFDILENKFEFNVNSEIEKPQINKANIYDIVEYILKKVGKITAMKLQKILYYCQAWSLVWDDEPLFQDEIEAWANGPVIRKIFNLFRSKYYVESPGYGNPDLLNQTQKDTIDAVINFYGNKTAQWLIELSHSEEPWKNARKGLNPNERGNKIIEHSSIANYYSSL